MGGAEKMVHTTPATATIMPYFRGHARVARSVLKESVIDRGFGGIFRYFPGGGLPLSVTADYYRHLLA
jgi:hypothetical protein